MELLCQDYKGSRGKRIKIEGTKVVVTPCDADSASERLIISPGLVDLQINGYGGIDFNDADANSVESIQYVVEKQWALGITSFFPTITTHSFEHMQNSLRVVAKASHLAGRGKAIPGIHLEGPYISPEDGPRGAHPKEYVRTPCWDEFQRWQEAAEGLIKIVTLSPEYPEAIPFIERLVENGVVAAIGHTNATSEQIKAAVDAGASFSTHLGNGAHNLIKRHPNYIWDQLAEDRLTAGLIVDGYHLPPSVVKTMTRAKGWQRVVLVTDAVSVAGLPPGKYSTLGTEVDLTEGGCVRLSGTPYLAGSALTMPQAVINAAKYAEIPLDIAIDMASVYPAEFMKRQIGLELSSENQGTFVVFERCESRLEVKLTVNEHEVVFSAL